MSLPGASVYLLPPRPELRDWPVAGACAGLLLGLAELALAAPLGSPPTRLGLLTIAAPAFALACAAFAVGCALQLLGLRPSHSVLVAWVTGLIPLASAAPIGLPHPGASPLLGLAAFGLAAVGMLGVSAVAARIADRSERAGTPARGILWWSATALLVAAGERIWLGPGSTQAAWLAGLCLAGAAAACAIYLAARRRGASPPRAPFGRILVALVLAAAAAAAVPWALPWLLTERELPASGDAPANILIVALGSASRTAAGTDSNAEASFGGWTGIRYEPLVPEPGDALESLLSLPDGAALVPALAADGYRTAMIRTDAGVGHDFGARQVDGRPGALAQLRGDLRWLAAAPWLAGPGRRALERLGLGGDVRTPEQLSSDARGWLLRQGASEGPFFLLVDFRHRDSAVAAAPELEDAALTALLDHLDQVGLSQRTLVVLARTGGSHEPPLSVVVRPPLAWPDSSGGRVAVRPVQASELGATLRKVARGNGKTPVVFPGVV
jgi:hypothetical protein